jgi:uncharacterized protein (TIGR03437 family)
MMDIGPINDSLRQQPPGAGASTVPTVRTVETGVTKARYNLDMPRGWLAAATATLLAVAAAAQVRTVPPVYSETSILNSIHPAAPLSINGYVTIYGKDLSWNTASVTEESLRAGTLPTQLGGVRVLLGLHFAHLLYVSPGQVNLLVPNNLLPQSINLTIQRDGTAGQPALITIVESGPVLFSLDADTVLAAHSDGTIVTRENPARAGEIVVVYAGGLGQTKPPQSPGKLAPSAAAIERRKDFQLLLNGEPVNDIVYAGVTPTFAGLYQVNFRVPENLASSRELRITLGEQSSQYNLLLPVAPPPAALRWFLP